jgi:ABC-type branched-subunit amino acid transport system substrate-binding protein
VVRYTNDQGGLNSRKIKTIEVDDQGSATTGPTAVRKAVEQDAAADGRYPVEPVRAAG